MVIAVRTDIITVGERFNGPPGMGNGGYTAGLAAAFLDGTVEVTLRRPVPLGQPLPVEASDDGVVVGPGDAPIVVARSAALELDLPVAPTLDDAIEASARYGETGDHAFPTCFVCGPARHPGDGMCIFPWPLRRRPLLAAPWSPDVSFADGSGRVRPEFVWAALDCPGGIAAVAADPRPIVLGRLTADVASDILAGETYVVAGWVIGREGRKYHTGTAIFTSAGEPVARARGIWFELNR